MKNNNETNGNSVIQKAAAFLMILSIIRMIIFIVTGK